MQILKDNAIRLDKQEVLELCKPGEESNTCIWLMASSEGFECCYYNRPSALAKRYLRGLTVAKRDGCDKVKSLNLKVKYSEAKTLADYIEGGG